MRASSTSARVVGATVTALLLLEQAVSACPGCKQAEGQPLNGASVGFGWGVLFLLCMVAATLGSLGWMMYRSCQALAVQHRLAAEGASAAAG